MRCRAGVEGSQGILLFETDAVGVADQHAGGFRRFDFEDIGIHQFNCRQQAGLIEVGGGGTDGLAGDVAAVELRPGDGFSAASADSRNWRQTSDWNPSRRSKAK